MERKNSPIDSIVDGNIRAKIWENESDNGPFHSTKISKIYTDRDGNPKDTHSFSTGDLLRVSEIAREAYRRSNEIRRENAQDRGQQTDRRDDRQESSEQSAPRGRRNSRNDRDGERSSGRADRDDTSERRESFREDRRGGGGGGDRHLNMPRRSDPLLRDRFSDLSFP